MPKSRNTSSSQASKIQRKSCYDTDISVVEENDAECRTENPFEGSSHRLSESQSGFDFAFALGFSFQSSQHSSDDNDGIIGPPTNTGVKKSSNKRKLDEETEAPCKRIRKNPSPSEDNVKIHGPTNRGGKKGSQKRKLDEETTAPRKRARNNPSPSEDDVTNKGGKISSQKKTSIAEAPKPTRRTRKNLGLTDEDSETSRAPSKKGGKNSSQKKKSIKEASECTKRARKTPSPSEGANIQTAPTNTRAAFEAMYVEKAMLHQGGFACVYVGYRREDNKPVAIKHIPGYSVNRPLMLDDGTKAVPTEVAMMLKLQPAEGTANASVTLLDWYDLDDELILVLERPVPCLDIIDYNISKGGVLPEHEAKIIVKLLVDAVIEVQSKGVFHGDIKPDNILVETSSDVPRVRLIDFGCSTNQTENKYTVQQGTYYYTSPEFFTLGWYKAEPTTVWQLGVSAFGIIHGLLPFKTSLDIVDKSPSVNCNLSDDCRNFLMSCLAKNMDDRPTLSSLKHHPWLK